MQWSKRLQRISSLCFGLMWLPFIGIFISMIGMPSSGYAWGDLPVFMWVCLIATGLCFVGGFGGMIGAQIARSLATSRIRAHGRPADATVVRVWDTGTTINEQPVIGLLLDVQPPDQPSFRAETRYLVSRLEMGHLRAGTHVRVKYVPGSREVALDTGSPFT